MSTAHATSVYRMTQFAVPAAARQEFLARAREAAILLAAQPGLLRNTLLEQPQPDGTSRIVTLAEWRDDAAMEAATVEVRKQQEAQGFNPQDLRARLNIQAETSQYRALAL